MKYEGTEIKDYSHEDIIEILKDHYLIRKNDSKKYYALAAEDNFYLLRAEVSKIKSEFESFDDIHRDNIEQMINKRNELEENDHRPLVGDYIRLKSGVYLRVTVENDENRFQAYTGGSYHLTSGGHFSYSGSCGHDLFDKSNFKLTKEERLGSFWFWHTRKGVGGGNRVNAKALFRVFTEIE